MSNPARPSQNFTLYKDNTGAFSFTLVSGDNPIDIVNEYLTLRVVFYTRTGGIEVGEFLFDYDLDDLTLTNTNTVSAVITKERVNELFGRGLCFVELVVTTATKTESLYVNQVQVFANIQGVEQSNATTLNVDGDFNVTLDVTSLVPQEDLAYTSVTKFGAVGDGVTDDTDAIQRTIDFVSELGGGVVFIPEGNFLVSNVNSNNYAILLKSNVNLFGGGKSSRITLDPTVTGLDFDFRVIATGTFDIAYSNISARDFYVYGNQIAIGGEAGSATEFIQGFGNALRNEPLLTATNIKVENCIFEDVNIGVGYAKNIDANHSTQPRLDAQFTNITVEKCTVINCQNKAIELQETYGGAINNNYCDNVYDGPQAINSSRGISINENKVFYKNFGISITHNVKDCEVLGNYVECIEPTGGFGSMIFRTEEYATVSKIENIKVSNNTFKDSVNRLNLRFIGKLTNVVVEFNDIFIEANTFYDQVNFYEEIFEDSVFNNIYFRDNEVKWNFETEPESVSEMNNVFIEGNRFVRSITFNGTGWNISKYNVFESALTFSADSSNNIFVGNRFKVVPITDNGTNNKGITNSNVQGSNVWFIQSGSANTSSSPITFPTAFGTTPNVVCTPINVGATRSIVINTISSTQFTLTGYNVSGTATNFDFQWIAFGRK